VVSGRAGYSRRRSLPAYRHPVYGRYGPIVIMIVAIVSTKIPILLGHDFWIFHVQKLPRYGFWSMAHEARADFCMMLGALSLDRGRRRLVARRPVGTTELAHRTVRHPQEPASRANWTIIRRKT
jgi:hypothetical protein